MAHDVFISYSIKDKTIADAVCAKLEENGIRVWIAPRDVPPGSNFAESIVDAIDNCKVFVLIWSAEANVSKHILNEVNQAFDQGIIIIPFRIQDTQPTRAMRYYIGHTHWLDAIDPPLEEHITTLTDTILINLGREPQDKPQPVTPEQPSTDLPIEPVQSPPQAPVTEGLIEEKKEEKPPAKPSRQKTREKGSNPFQSVKTTLGNLPKFVPVAAGAFVVLTLVILLVSGVFKGTPPSEIAEVSPSPTQTIAPTPSATPIPTRVMDANEVADPILAVINDTPPDFADDFSQVDPAWLYYGEDPSEEMGCDQTDDVIMGITDGTMNLSLANCRVGILIHPQMHYNNYALQMDLNFQETALGIEFRNWNQSLSGDSTMLSFFLNSRDGSWNFQALELDDVIFELNGKIGLYSSIPVTVTIINRSPTFLVYVDSSLLMTYQNPPENHQGQFMMDFTVNSWETMLTEPQMLELDNVNVWDLDKIDIADSNQTSDWMEDANALAEPILAAINDTPPDFADDFSLIDPAWDHWDGGGGTCAEHPSPHMNIADGSIKIYVEPNCHVRLDHPYFQLLVDDFVFQVDINFSQTTNIEVGLNSSNRSVMNFLLATGSWAIFTQKPNSEVWQTVQNGTPQFDASRTAALTLLKKDTTILFYLNSVLLTSYEIQAEDADGLEFSFLVSDSQNSVRETLELDNIKFWDLDRIDIADSGQTSDWVEEAHELAEPILALIEERPPDFDDDFSQVDPGWLYYPEEPGEEVGCFETDGVAMSITDGTMNPSLAKCRVGILIHPDMEYSNYVLQLDVNFQQTILGLEFRNWDQSQSGDGTMLMFWVRGLDGFWVFQAMENEDVLDRDEGKIGLDSSKPVTVTIINKSPAFLVYVDSSLLVTYHSPPGINEGPFLLDFTVNTWETTLTEPETLEIDNVMVWDLDKIE